MVKMVAETIRMRAAEMACLGLAMMLVPVVREGGVVEAEVRKVAVGAEAEMAVAVAAVQGAQDAGAACFPRESTLNNRAKNVPTFPQA